MMRYVAVGLVIAVLAGYLLLPADKRGEYEAVATKLSEETKELLQGYCSETLDLPREYAVALIRKAFPEYPDEGVCGLLDRHIADDAINQG